MRAKFLAVVILVLSAVIGLSVFEGSAGAVRQIIWTQTAGGAPAPPYCPMAPSGTITTTETSRTGAAVYQAHMAIFSGGAYLFVFNGLPNSYGWGDGCDDSGANWGANTGSGGTWSCALGYGGSHCAGFLWQGTWDVIVSTPTVSVIASPSSVTTAWQNTDAQASVSCSQPLGSCDASSHRLLVYYSSPPGTCPTDYNSYTLSSPQTISSHAWVCAAAKDTTGDAGFSPSPVEFLVEKIPPTGTISIDNGALYTTSSSVTLYLTYSDNADGSGIKDCRYSNDGVFDTEPWEPCTDTKSNWPLIPGLGSRTIYYQIRDNVGNTYETSDSIFVISSTDVCNYASNGFYCCVRNGACQGSEVDVFHMFDRMNSHAEILPQNLYPYKVCCGGVPGLGTNCNGLYDILIKLSSTTNAHVEKDTFSNYLNPACISITAGNADCVYADGGANCPADYACVSTISADTNAHVSDCDGINDYTTKVCCKFGPPPPPPCVLQTATITPNCAGGSSPNCEVGETISMSATTTGYCDNVKFFQIDASGSGCSIEYSGGDVSGISQNNPTIGVNTVTGTWTITSIPLACSGKTVTASAAGLYNPGPPPTGPVGAIIFPPVVTGSFTFVDVIPPTTLLNPFVPDPTNDNTPTYTGTATDASSNIQTVQYRINVGAWQNAQPTDGSFNSPSEGFTFTPSALADGTYLFEARAQDSAGNWENSPYASDTLTIDTTAPTFTVSVWHSPANPTDLDPVTFTAAASDSGSGLSQIIIYVDGVPIGSCGSSPCVITPGTYPSGTHTYYVIARDLAGNQARDPPAGDKQFTVTGCILTSATITPNCAGGSSPNCEVGETISMSATTIADCSAVRFFQIDASGGCSVQYSVPPGDLSGISQNNPVIGINTVTGTWTITSIPLACSGKTVTASAAGLYNPGPPPAGLSTLILAPLVTGSFTFVDVIPPTTLLNPFVPDPTNDNTPTYTGTATDASSNIQTVQYRINVGAWQNAQPTDGSFNSPSEGFTFTPSALADGTYLFEVISQDSAGNWQIAPYPSDTLTIDTTPPSATINPLPAWTNLSSFPVSWSGSDSGSGISTYNVQYKSTQTDGALISDWTDWLSKTALTSASFGPAQNNYTYYFKVNATDNTENPGPYSAERSISVDTESPNISYTVNDDKANSIFNLTSVAWDNVSGIFNHTISCIAINPSSTNFSQCSSAVPFGGISPCQTDAIPYTDETEISCEIRAQDMAGNIYSTNIFFTTAPDNLIMKLYEHNIFISIGESYHIRIQLRNIKPTLDMINVSLQGTYPSGLARFLQSSPIIWLSSDKRNITALLNPYEQKTIYVEIISTDQGDFTLDLQAGSQTYPIKSSDSLSIMIGFPAAFPGLEIYSIAAILSVAGLAYFRYLRRQNKI